MALTSHLLERRSSVKYIAATQHEFLVSAANGTLHPSRLGLWLSQDRIYAAHAYPRFIGSLIAHIPFADSDAASDSREIQNQHILQVLVACLDGIVREIAFFGNVAAKHNLDIQSWQQRDGTARYTREMARVSESASFEEGLVFLWAMEQVYFDAWSTVKQQQLLHNGQERTSLYSAVDELATNWSTPQFSEFVQSLRHLVDGLNIKPDASAWTRAVETWDRVIDLEIDFWPNEEEGRSD